MEVLEELEEFSERERDFENKYVKTISQLKNDAQKTDNELAKVRDSLCLIPWSISINFLDKREDAWIWRGNWVLEQ